MEEKTIQEQIKTAFEGKLSQSPIVSEAETKQICAQLYQKMSTDKAVDLMYKIIGGDLGENTTT